jgi:hypothetical protein
MLGSAHACRKYGIRKKKSKTQAIATVNADCVLT